MRNAECGIDRATVEPRSELAGSTSALQFRIPHSALRIRGGAGAVRVVLQRVSRAEVRVNGRVTGKIGVGFLVLAGFAPSDTAETLAWMADKLLGRRVFADADGKMPLGLAKRSPWPAGRRADARCSRCSGSSFAWWRLKWMRALGRPSKPRDT